MKRRFFLVAGAGSLALAHATWAPALAALPGHPRLVANGAFRKPYFEGATPGGCSTHRTASASGGYTLAFALGRISKR